MDKDQTNQMNTNWKLELAKLIGINWNKQKLIEIVLNHKNRLKSTLTTKLIARLELIYKIDLNLLKSTKKYWNQQIDWRTKSDLNE